LPRKRRLDGESCVFTESSTTVIDMLNANSQQRYSAWPHRWAMAIVCAAFPLIWMGGLVTTNAAGMAVPDWPTTYGYNMFLYPWSTWFWGPYDIFIEHGHRLLGSLAGLLTIGFVIAVWRSDSRPWMRWCALGALLLVCVQGGLGGARVLLDERRLAMLHGCLGPAFLAYIMFLTVATSRWWRDVPWIAVGDGVRLQRLALLTIVLTYLQLVVGARIRHLPVTASPQEFRVAVLFHLGLAFAVVGHALILAWQCWRQPRVPGRVRVAAGILAALFVVQPLLGAATWVVKFGWPLGLSDRLSLPGVTVVARSMAQSVTITAHVATGSLLLALCMVVLVSTLRIYRDTRGSDATAILASTWEGAR
jgi:heme a synthase